MKVNDAESVGVLVGETILELQKEVIIVTAYSSDNCPVMDAAATTASVVAFKKIRVPCASHAFNNILKALIRENCLKYLWDSVVLYCFHDGTGLEGKPTGQTYSVLRQRFYELQADYPFTSLHGKVNGVAPSFVPPQLEWNAQRKTEVLFWKQGSRRLSQEKRSTTFTWSLKSVRTTRIKRMVRAREDRRRRLTSCCLFVTYVGTAVGW